MSRYTHIFREKFEDLRKRHWGKDRHKFGKCAPLNVLYKERVLGTSWFMKSLCLQLELLSSRIFYRQIANFLALWYNKMIDRTDNRVLYKHVFLDCGPPTYLLNRQIKNGIPPPLMCVWYLNDDLLEYTFYLLYRI